MHEMPSHQAHQGHQGPHGHHNSGTHAHASHGAPQTTGRVMRWARLYDPMLRLMAFGQIRKFRSLPLELAHLRPGERVLDVGCGTGDLTLAAAKIVGPSGQVWGIDASPQMIEVATRKAARVGRRAHNLKFSVEAVEALSFPEASFDVVLSSLMMHHLPGDLKARALREMRRVLRPGGRLIVIDLQPLEEGKRGKFSGGPLLWAHRRPRPTNRAAGTMPHPAPGTAGLAPFAQEAGLVSVETGTSSQAWLGYLRAQAPS